MNSEIISWVLSWADNHLWSEISDEVEKDNVAKLKGLTKRNVMTKLYYFWVKFVHYYVYVVVGGNIEKNSWLQEKFGGQTMGAELWHWSIM